MTGYKENLEKATLENENFRKVVYTASNSQLVLMRLKLGEEIGMEVHDDTDQFFRFESGKGLVVIDGAQYQVSDGDAVIVPQGAMHNVINASETEDLKLYTIYSPPHHMDKTVHATKAEAEAADEHYDGTNTEGN